MTTGFKRRAGPLFGAGLVTLAILATFTPVVPRVSATDPTPDPSATSADAEPVRLADAEPHAEPHADPDARLPVAGTRAVVQPG